MCKQKNNTLFLAKIIVYVQVDPKKKKFDLRMYKAYMQVHMGISVSPGAQSHK